MTLVRSYRPADDAAVRDVCVRTGDDGQDASPHLPEPGLLADVWVAPYLALEPEHAVVIEDDSGVAGYAVGAVDSRRFEGRAESEWWPALRRRVPEPHGHAAAWGLPDRLAHLVHHPPSAPQSALDAGLPSHAHLDLLPRAQGRGHGAGLLTALLAGFAAAGSTGVHVGVSPANARGLRFWRRQGFADIETTPYVVWLGRRLP